MLKVRIGLKSICLLQESLIEKSSYFLPHLLMIIQHK